MTIDIDVALDINIAEEDICRHTLVLAGVDPKQNVYLNNQKDYISNEFSDLDIKIVDTDSEYVSRYNKKVGRFPFILLLKHNSFKSSVNAKISNETLKSWLLDNFVK